MTFYETESEVFVFHDETGKAGDEKLKGHIILFIPVNLRIYPKDKTLFDAESSKKSLSKELPSLDELFSKMWDLREKYNADHKFHFKEISGKKWTKHNEAERQLLLLGVDALRNKRPKMFKSPLMCKMAVIFFPTPTPENLNGYGGNQKDEKRLRYNETILRTLLKGALHYLYDQDNKVTVLKIITDGQPYHRKLSEVRILWRLIEESLSGNLRDYVDIPIGAEIIHLESDHKKHKINSEEYIYANILQLADMLLGSVIQSCLKGTKWQNLSPKIGDEVDDKKSIIAYPVKEMLDKRKRGKNFENSGHYKSFTISKAYTVNGKWQFESIMTKEIVIDKDSGNITLFDFMKGMT